MDTNLGLFLGRVLAEAGMAGFIISLIASHLEGAVRPFFD